jgi:hypothetical protein
MILEKSITECPKCHWDLLLLNRNKAWVRDIAHNEETVEVAMAKLQESLEYANLQKYGQLKLIVGNGKIKEDAEKILSYLQYDKKIKSYTYEGFNPGALIANLL